jgi:hypothetical protein
LEASLDHLLVTPPSHFAPQKVGGFGRWLTGYGWAITERILYQAEILSREILLILFVFKRNSKYIEDVINNKSKSSDKVLENLIKQ